jgi:transposase
LFEELRALGYEGGYDAVRRYVRIWSRDHASHAAAAFVPLSFAPGEPYQFDWSHEIVVMNGATVTVKVAHVRLCHGRMMSARAYPRETQEMVFDAHERAFAFFRGACTRGIYDNMKTAVDAIFVGKDRQYNRRFLQMCSHHLVDPVACTPASGWEKGEVENRVGLVRERFFTPRLRIKTYDELNAWLTDKCVAYAKADPHPDRPEQTVWEVFEEERPNLVPYRGRFDGFHGFCRKVRSTAQAVTIRDNGINEIRLLIRNGKPTLRQNLWPRGRSWDETEFHEDVALATLQDADRLLAAFGEG